MSLHGGVFCFLFFGQLSVSLCVTLGLLGLSPVDITCVGKRICTSNLEAGYKIGLGLKLVRNVQVLRKQLATLATLRLTKSVTKKVFP